MPASLRPRTGTCRSWPLAGSFERTCTFAWPLLSSGFPPCGSGGTISSWWRRLSCNNYGIEHAKPGLTFAPDSLRALSLHRWPGNVRELQNRVQRAVIMADGKRLTARDLELTDTLSALPPQTLKEARESVDREMVQDALRRHRGKITSAAVELGVSRPTPYELMEKLGIVRDS
jgi:two-component system, NtrC family, response regulator